MFVRTKNLSLKARRDTTWSNPKQSYSWNARAQASPAHGICSPDADTSGHHWASIHSVRPSETKNDGDYEYIASEYYESRHITSRNFDAVTLSFCRAFSFSIPPRGLVLDLGAGRGYAGRYCRIETDRVIQVDISQTMLSINPREESLDRIRCDALSLPFLGSKIAAVTAFLYDAYNKPEFYREVRRVLRSGGLFVGTLPHHAWGTTLRRVLGYNKNKTKFLTKDNYLVELDSFLMTDFEICTAMQEAGLRLLEMYDLCLPPNVEDVSDHILIPASYLGLSTHGLPIVKLIIAVK